MKKKILYFLFSVLTLTSCFDSNTKIKGHAIIVDNFKDRNPLEGIYVEVKYTNDEGYNYEFLDGVTTDRKGYFEINTAFPTGLFDIDSWAYAGVYSDTDHTDTLGSFNFQYPGHTYSYQTIHLDTFALSHNVWVIPRIGALGNYQPDEISISYDNCDLTGNAEQVRNYYGSIKANQTFEPVEIKMSMNLQHWLSYGTRDLAIASLRKDSKQILFGYFKLENPRRTVEGDTLYLDFHPAEIQ